MIKTYTQYDYLDMVVKANEQGKLVEVYTEIVLKPVYNEEGEPTGEYVEVEYEKVRLIDNPNINLKMTPLDFLKALDMVGIDYDTVKQIMASNPMVERELMYCQFVYRKHPMIEQFAQQYGITDEQLDYIFKQANNPKVEEGEEE